MFPRLSIIISTYNSEAFLRGRLENLIAQTMFPQMEVIVVNSGSRQNEELIVKDFQNRYPNIVYLSTPERETIYKAWNRGIAIARGTYIANANTDDRTRVDGMEVFAATLDRNPDAAMVYSDQYVTSVAGSGFENDKRKERLVRYPFSRLRLLAGYFLGSQQMWRASLHHVDGIWFDEHFEVSGDYDFACRVAERYNVVLVKDVLGMYYLSASRSNKQYQNEEQFLSEDSGVRRKYVHRYLASISEKEFEDLYRRMNLWMCVPRYAYTVLHRTINVIDRRKQILNRIFWCWLGSYMEEKLGNIERAKMLCRKYSKIPSAAILRARYRELTNTDIRALDKCNN